MKKSLAALAVGLASIAAAPVTAESCGGVYTVQRGDSLSAIADKHYKNAGMWTTIHTGNLQTIGPKPSGLQAGANLQLACINGLPLGLGGNVTDVVHTAAPVQSAPDTSFRSQRQKIYLLTGDDFAPFTHRGLMEDGLLAEVVTAAMTEAVGDDGFQTFWVNDWSSHLNALMPANVVEMAYPWAKPDCQSDPNQKRCIEFHFSQPMFEYLVLLFVDKSRPIPFDNDADIHGRTICRPAGYLTHMLDKDGRNWVSEGKITLKQPDKVSDCFDMLIAGEVDAVILNEFTARDAIYAMDLQDQVEPVLSSPVSITGLHVLIHKGHPRAEKLLENVNRGLAAIKGDGQYQEIVNRHMASIWSNYDAN